jgi:CCR4-NOT complex subunit CAF16
MPVPVAETGYARSTTEHARVDANTDAGASVDWWARMASAKAASDADPNAPKPWLRRPGRDAVENASRAPTRRDLAVPTGVLGIEVRGLTFSYPGIDGTPMEGTTPMIRNLKMALEPGTCTLLLGANGAGKTTLLKILAGKHLVEREKVLVLGREAFYDTGLTSSGDLSFIGGNWQRDVAFAGYNIPLAGDFPASRMLDSIPGVDPERKKRIIEVLDVNVNWRMHQVSDGQRRRVQLAWGLMLPYKVLLLDEITVDLDVLGRAELMGFLREECLSRQVTIVYATHIFDGLESFMTHVAFVANGELKFCKKFQDIEGLKEREPGSLLLTVEGWLREEYVLQRERKLLEKAEKKEFQFSRNNGYASGRTTTTVTYGERLGEKGWLDQSRDRESAFQNSSNAVMR